MIARGAARARDDDKQTVGDLVENFTGQVGEKIEIRRFVRYSLGEEI